jgi:hypothetical protein
MDKEFEAILAGKPDEPAASCAECKEPLPPKPSTVGEWFKAVAALRTICHPGMGCK